MRKQAVAGLILAGLAIGVWLLWPRDGTPDPAAPSTVAASETTTRSETPSTISTTTQQPTTSVTGDPEGHVVETVEEAEEILRELWFGWFEGIYDQDVDRIREVVATEEQVESGREAFGLLEFTTAPQGAGLRFIELELLLATDDCTAIWSVSNADFLAAGPDRSGVEVIRWTSSGWRLMSSWAYKEDLWHADCESSLDPSF